MSDFNEVEMDGIIDFPEATIKGVYDGLGLSDVIFDVKKYQKAEKDAYFSAFFQAFHKGVRETFNPEYTREVRQDDYENVKASIERVSRMKGFYADEIIKGYGFIESQLITINNKRLQK